VRDFLRGLCSRLEAEPARATRICETAARFDAYLRTAPELVLLKPSGAARVRRTARVRFSLSKISTVTATATRRGRVVWTRSARLGRGRHAFALRPARAGPLTLALRAVDLAGNAATAGGVLHVRPGRR
jgi:hypothetical protein